MKLWKGIKLSGDLKKSSTKAVLAVALLLIAVGVWGRFIPHAPNMAPIAAVAIFAGAVLPRKYALVAPMAAIIISDLFIGLHSTIFWTWGSFALIALISSGYLREKINVANTLAVTLSGSVVFYILTNFGVWLQTGMYQPTLNGLIQSYINALPFFRNTLIGDLIYVGVLFGAFYLAQAGFKALHRNQTQELTR